MFVTLLYQVWPTPTPLPPLAPIAPDLEINAQEGFVDAVEIAVQWWHKMGDATDFLMLVVILIIVFFGFMLIYRRLQNV